jgi:hypothetical protein
VVSSVAAGELARFFVTHPMCRCVVLPVLKSRDEILGLSVAPVLNNGEGETIPELAVTEPGGKQPLIARPAIPKSAQEMLDARAYLLEHNYSRSQIRSNVDWVVSHTPRSVWKRGLNWYSSDAHVLAVRLAREYRVPASRVAAALAVTSPAIGWSKNSPEGPFVRNSNQALTIRIMDAILGKKFEPFEFTQEFIEDQHKQEEERIDKWRKKYPDKKPPPRLWLTRYNGVDPHFPRGTDLTGMVLAIEEMPSDVAAKVYKGHFRGLPSNVEKAIRVLRGDDPDEVIRGPKTRSYYNNVLDPLASAGVAIDTHMVRAMLKQFQLSRRATEKYIKTDSQYKIFSDIIEERARLYKVLPHQLQAIIWLMMREKTAELLALEQAQRETNEESNK